MAFLPGQRRRREARLAGALVSLLPIPVYIKAILALWAGDLATLTAAGVASALFAAAAVSARAGLKGESDDRQRPFTRARRWPLKSIGGALLAAATAVTAYFVAGHTLPVAIVFAALAAAGFALFYGSGARDGASIRLASTADAEEVKAILGEAYGRLDRIERAGERIGSIEFRQRLASIGGATEKILKAIEDNPRELRRARRFLNVYLDGVQRVAEQYAQTHSQTASVGLEHNFRTLLVEMENICDEQYNKLIQHQVVDLDVQIDVLNSRLKQEGVI